MFPFVEQENFSDCGPACIVSIARYYGKEFTISDISRLCRTSSHGTTLLDIIAAAEQIGFKVLPVKISISELTKKVPLPAIIHWERKHFVVVYKVDQYYIYLSDPSIGLLTYRHDEFLKNWLDTNISNGLSPVGVALLFELV